MTAIARVAAVGFGAAADAYERGRPGYPADAVAWLAERLGIGRGRTVLDLAAGTGKLTRLLVPLGARVVAVEPVAAMRARLEALVPAAEALEGTAEAIPLAEGSVDAALVAQAFHWFDHPVALCELHRVLRPGGGLGLVWNARDLAEPVNARLDELLAPHRGETAALRDIDHAAVLAASGLFAPPETRTFRHEQRLDLDGLVDRVASTSFVAALPEEARAPLLEAVRAAGREAGEPVVLCYVTHALVAARIPRPEDPPPPPFE